MSCCCKCGHSSSTKAHVKDKEVCINEGNKDHENLNIINLCYNCHYLLFDKGKMGIKIENEDYYFLWINNENEIIKSKTIHSINVLPEYIRWKNRKCKPKLLRQLFKK